MAASDSNQQWVPVVFTDEREDAGIRTGKTIRLDPQATENEAWALARQACFATPSAIGFTIESSAAAPEGGAA